MFNGMNEGATNRCWRRGDESVRHVSQQRLNKERTARGMLVSNASEIWKMKIKPTSSALHGLAPNTVLFLSQNWKRD